MSTKLPPLPKGYSRTYSQVFESDNRVCFSKWHTRQSCADAYAREEQSKAARFAALKASGNGETKAAIAKRQAQLRESQRRHRAKAKEVEAARKCPVCGEEPLFNTRQKKCQGCKAKARSERNRRHWKSLKTQNKTLSAAILPMKGMSTFLQSAVPTLPA